MEPHSIVLYQKDPGTAHALAVGLSQHFETVYLANTCQEVRPTIARHRAEVVVLDLETSGPDEVQRLHHEFPRLCIVGTHRLADDQLWTETMSLLRSRGEQFPLLLELREVDGMEHSLDRVNEVFDRLESLRGD